MPDMHWLIEPPGPYLLFGAVLVCASVLAIFTGKVSARFSWVYRADEPRTFWFLVAMYLLSGVCIIGYAFYKVSRFSK